MAKKRSRIAKHFKCFCCGKPTRGRFKLVVRGVVIREGFVCKKCGSGSEITFASEIDFKPFRP